MSSKSRAINLVSLLFLLSSETGYKKRKKISTCVYESITERYFPFSGMPLFFVWSQGSRITVLFFALYIQV